MIDTTISGSMHSMPGKSRRGILWWAVLLVLVGSGLLMAIDPASTNIFPPCPFRALTGCYCPGCGTLRGIHQLFRGDLLAALKLNPLMVLSLPFLGYSMIAKHIIELTHWRLPRPILPATWIWTLLGIIILFWLLRNLPVQPFTTLAP